MVNEKKIRIESDNVIVNFKEINDGDVILVVIPEKYSAKINTEILRYYTNEKNMIYFI